MPVFDVRVILAAGRTLTQKHGLDCARAGISPNHLIARAGNASMAVLLETTLGDIVIDLFTEERPKSKKMQTLVHKRAR